MDKRTWIRNEIAAWRAEGLVDAETASRLDARYAAAAGRLSWGILLAGTFGAFLTGLGVIALVAANWDDFGRAARTAVAFLPVLGCGAAAAGLSAKGRTGAAVMEPLGVLWLCAVAAGSAIVAQTWQIGDSAAGLMLFIAALGWPVLWATRSRLSVLAWTVFAICWPFAQLAERGEGAALALGAPAAILGLSAVAWTFAARSRGEGAFTASCRGLLGLAHAFGLPLVFVAAHPWKMPEIWNFGVFFGAAALAGAAGWATRHRAWSAAGVMVAIGTAVPTFLPARASLFGQPAWMILVWYGVSLALAAGLAVRGIFRRDPWLLNAGALLGAWLVLAKYCESDASFTTKGLVLIGAGAAVWALNWWMVRMKKREAAQ